MIAIINVIVTIIIISSSNISDVQIGVLSTRFMFVGRKFKIVLVDVLVLQSEGRYYLFLTTVLSHAPHPLQWRINRRPATFIYSSIPLSRIFRHRSFFNQASKVSHTTLNCPFPTALAAPSLRSQRLTVVLPIFFKLSF